MIASKDRKLREISDIVEALSDSTNYRRIRSAINHIIENPDLERIEMFRPNCEYVLQKLKETEEKKTGVKHEGAYTDVLERIVKSVENHGIPRRGHLDDTAKDLLEKIESKEFSHLLDNAEVAISYGKVKAHYRDWKHTADYEAHLNHLYGLIKEAKKDKK